VQPTEPAAPPPDQPPAPRKKKHKRGSLTGDPLEGEDGTDDW
jgi:hypothetical protein